MLLFDPETPLVWIWGIGGFGVGCLVGLLAKTYWHPIGLSSSALRQSEERYRWMADNSNDLISRHTPDGIYLYASPASRSLLGYEPEEMIGRSLYDFFHPEDAAAFQRTQAIAGRLPPTFSLSYRARHKNGNYIWLEMTSRIIRDSESGADQEIVVVSRDITERKQAEQILQESEERFYAAFEDAAIGIALVSLEGRWLQVNHFLCEMLGYSEAQLLATDFQSLTYPDDLEKDLACVRQLLDGEMQTYQLQKRYLHQQGQLVWALLGVALVRNLEGEPLYFVVQIQDITHQKQAEWELQRQNQRSHLFAELTLKIRQSLQLETILQTAVTEVQQFLQAERVLVFRLMPDGGGKVVQESVVPGWPQILDQEMVDPCFHQGYLAQYRNGRIGIMTAIPQTETPSCYVEMLQRLGVKANLIVPILQGNFRATQEPKADPNAPGTTLWGLLIAHQCSHSRQWSAFEVELLRQLADQIGIALAQAHLLERERQQQQALARSNEELQQFAYVASHDLQEPLRKIQTFSDRLKVRFGDVLPEDALDYLDRMQNAAERMQQLIRDLLTLSRISTRAQVFVPTDLNQIVQEVLTDLEVPIQESQGQVRVDPLPQLAADSVQMRQLFQNLIGNALKFVRPGHPPLIQISCQIIQLDDANQAIAPAEACQIWVADNGIGFDEKYLTRIYNPFQRLHSQDEYEGTGMGLAICRKIVERHGGSLTASSIVGQGSTFMIMLPLRHPPGGAPE